MAAKISEMLKRGHVDLPDGLLHFSKKVIPVQDQKDTKSAVSGADFALTNAIRCKFLSLSDI